MRLLYVVQRYGDDIAGGAEQFCREVATRMCGCGHRVEVLTTCAHSYTDWANAYPPGTTREWGVLVHRLPVAQRRPHALFDQLGARMRHGARPRPLELQREWVRMQGPWVPELPAWLRRRATDYDAVVFVTYLYWPTWAGLRCVAGRVPTVLHPALHDEPPLWFSVFDEVVHRPDALAVFTPEERDLVARRFRSRRPVEVVGIGTEVRPATTDRFRARAAVGDDPYLLYVGRVDPAKGAAELVDFFVTYKDRNPGPLRLVLLGQPVMTLPRRDDVVVTGFVDTATRDSAIAGALALVQPSYFESFSMVLTEAFAQGRPGLVQSRCEVLLGHARRSGAALPYAGYAEFEAALEMLETRPGLADALGARGRAYVDTEYAWPVVLERYERFLRAVVAGSPAARDRASDAGGTRAAAC
jgi:glycosyltransferase involved in cell wall biosynthesis